MTEDGWTNCEEIVKREGASHIFVEKVVIV